MSLCNLFFTLFLILFILMKEALLHYVAGEWPGLRRPQGQSEYPTFRNAPGEVLAVVEQKLSEQSYSHYAD